MIVLSRSMGNVLLRMSILAQLPKVIFLSKLRYKSWCVVDPCVYIHTSHSEMAIMLLPSRHVLSGFGNPSRPVGLHLVVKEDGFQWKP